MRRHHEREVRGTLAQVGLGGEERERRPAWDPLPTADEIARDGVRQLLHDATGTTTGPKARELIQRVTGRTGVYLVHLSAEDAEKVRAECTRLLAERKAAKR